MRKYPFDLERLREVCRRHAVSMAGVFGSMATGAAGPDSDIDLIVRFSDRKSLLGLVRFERELAEALSRPVDVLSEAALSPYLRDRILRETQVVYEEG